MLACWGREGQLSPLAAAGARRRPWRLAAIALTLVAACGTPEPTETPHAIPPDGAAAPAPCDAARWPPSPRVQWSVGPGWQAVFGTLSPSPRLWPRELEANGTLQWAWTRWERLPQVAALEAPAGDWRWVLRRQGWWPWDMDGLLHTWWQPLEGRGLCLAEDRVLLGEMRQVGRLLEEAPTARARSGVPRHCPVHGAALDWRRTGAVEGVLRDAGVHPEVWPAWTRLEFCRVDQQVEIVVLLPPGEAAVGLAALNEAWTRLPGAALQWTCRTLAWGPIHGCRTTASLQAFGLRMGWAAQWVVGADEGR